MKKKVIREFGWQDSNRIKLDFDLIENPSNKISKVQDPGPFRQGKGEKYMRDDPHV